MGRQTYSLIPKVNQSRCHAEFYLNTLYTGHGAFPSYERRFFDKDDICWCKDGTGNLHHIVYSCKLLEDIRAKYCPKNVMVQLFNFMFNYILFLQMCDSQLNIDIVAHSPGSTHDSFIRKFSGVKFMFSNGYITQPAFFQEDRSYPLEQ